MMTGIPISEDLTHTVPKQIARTLTRLIRRNRMVILFRGLGATAAWAIAALLLIMASDAIFTFFAAWPRWALTLSAFASTLGVAYLFLFHPLARSFTLTGVARVIEDRHPELQERLSSAVELLTSQDGPEIRGSDALIAMLAAEATLDARSVRPRKEITFRPAAPFVLAAAAVIGILAGLYALWPDRTGRLLARALAPHANLPNVYASDLRMIPDGDVTIAEGDRLVITLEVANPKVGRASVRRVAPDGGETAEPMIALGEAGGWKKFTMTCAPASTSFRYRIHAGDALTQYINVTVVPRPAVRRLDLAYEFPKYTQRDPETVPNFQDVDEGHGKISAVAGTTVTLTATCNTPLSGAEVLVNDEPIDSRDVWVEPDGRTFKARILLKPKLAGLCTLRPLWALKLAETRTSDVEAEDEDQYEIEALHDRRPRVDLRVRKVEGKLKLKPTDSLPFGYTFSDDHGLTKAELLVRVDGRKRPPVPMELPAAGDKPLRRAQGASVLELFRLNLANARRVSFRLQATDNLPEELKGPQVGRSVEYTIELAVQEKPYHMQVTLAQELQIRRTLEKVLKELEETQKDSTPLRKEVPQHKELTQNSVERIGRMRKHLSKADSLLRELLPEMTGQAYAVLAKTLTGVADHHIAKAENLAGQILLTDEAKTRSELADETDFQVDRAHAIIAELLGKFSVMTDLVRRAQELKDLAERQKQLAAAKAALDQSQQPQGAEQDKTALKPPGDLQPMTREQIEREQAQIRERLRELARKTPGLLQAQAEADKKKTENLAQTARTLAKEQLALAGDTKQAGQLQQLEDAAKKLAAEQAALAKRAEAAKSTPEATQPMQKAADEIAALKLDDAVKKQTQAEGALKQQGEQIKQGMTTTDLAATAEKIAKAQAELAKAAKQAQTQYDAAQAKAQAAGKQDEAAKQQGQQAQAQIGSKLDELRKQQEALAKQAKALEGQVAANPAAQAAKDTKPSQPMDAAARNLAAKNLPRGLTEAKKATQQAQALEKKLAAATAQAQRRAQNVQTGAAQADQKAKQGQAQAQKAAQGAAQAKQQAEQDQAAAQKAKAAAQQAAVQGARADKAAGDAQAQAQKAKGAADQAQAAAQQAAAKARQPGLTPEQKKAAEAAARKAAAQAATAKQAAGQAQAAQQAAAKKAQAAKQTHQQAHQGAATAAKKAAASQRAAQQSAAAAQKADQQAKAQAQAAKQAQDATGQAGQATSQTGKSAAEAKQLAEAQKKLADQLAQLAGQQTAQQTASQKASRQAQAEVQKQAQAAGAAQQKVANLAGKQDSLKQQADQLARQAASATPQARQAVQQHNPSPAMQQAAQAQRAKAPAQAAQTTQQAADKAAQLAEALKKAAPQAQTAQGQPAGRPATTAQQARQAQTTGRLGTQQADLRRRTQELAAKRKQMLQAAEQGEMARLQAEQAEITRDAAKLADQVKESAPQPDRLDTKAARAAQQTGEQIAARDAAKAAQAAEDATGKMSELARRLGAEEADLPQGDEQAGQESGQKSGQESGQQSGQQSGQKSGQQSGQPSGQQSGKPSGQGSKSGQVAVKGSQSQQPGEPAGDAGAQRRAELADDTADLARRQDRVADQLRDLANERPQGVMASRQSAINQDTADLAGKAGLLKDHADDLIREPTAQQAAQQAVSALSRAAQAQQRASGAMPGTPTKAVPSQQAAAAQLSAAAGALSRLGQRLAAAAQKARAAEKADQPPEETSPLLTDALDQTTRAARSQQLQDAELAAQLLAQLATQANQQAEAMGLQPDAAMENLALTDPFGLSGGTGTGPQETDLTLLKLEEMGISPSDWARLPGQLRDEVLQAASDKSPPEYRALIKRYFQEVARESRRDQEPKTPEKNK